MITDLELSELFSGGELSQVLEWIAEGGCCQCDVGLALERLAKMEVVQFQGGEPSLTRLGTRIAFNYREFIQQREAGYSEKLRRSLRISPSSRVLDLGSGGGQTLVALAQAGLALGVGLDIDPISLRLHSVLNQYGINGMVVAVRGNSEELPFSDASFDRVISRVSLMYTRVPRVIQEVSRVAADSAIVYLHLTDFWFYFSKLVSFRWERGGVPFAIINGLLLQTVGRQIPAPTGRIMNYQTIGVVKRLLRKHDFNVVEVLPGVRHGLTPTLQPKIVAKRKNRG